MTTSEAIVYVVDDDESVRKAVSRLFRQAGFSVQTFRSANAFLDCQIGDQLACLILDVNMPGISGIELQERLAVNHSILPIVFLTGEGNIPMSVKAIKSGAMDFLPKPVDNDILLETVKRAIQHHSTDKLRSEELAEFLGNVDKLTGRERQVMELVVQGLLNKQVARRLEISEATVKVHRGRVMDKIGVDSIAQLARLCERAGLS